jgi:hypothetical protein
MAARLSISRFHLFLRPHLSEGLRSFNSPADYCTVRVTVPVAVVLPDVPVTVTV